MNPLKRSRIGRWCGWVGLILLCGMWLEMQFMPMSPTSLMARIFPYQIFVQFVCSAVLGFIAGIMGRRGWLAVGIIGLLSAGVFLVGVLGG